MFRFTIRELLWLMVVLVLTLGWCHASWQTEQAMMEKALLGLENQRLSKDRSIERIVREEAIVCPRQ